MYDARFRKQACFMDKDNEKANVDKLIDENLRRVYDSVLHEQIPDRFAQLLTQLEDGQSPSSDDEAALDRTGDGV